MHMQPSVMVVASDDQSQIKTHREARQQDSIEALMELYDTLPVDLSITRTLAKEPRFVYYTDALRYQYLKPYSSQSNYTTNFYPNNYLFFFHIFNHINRGSTRISSLFPTIEENDEIDEENEDGSQFGILSNDLLSVPPNSKEVRSSSTHSARITSNGGQKSIF